MSENRIATQESINLKTKKQVQTNKHIPRIKTLKDKNVQESPMNNQSCSNLIQFLQQKRDQSKLSKRMQYNQNGSKPRRPPQDKEHDLSLPDLKKENIFSGKEGNKKSRITQPQIISYKKSIMLQRDKIKTPLIKQGSKIRNSIDISGIDLQSQAAEVNQFKTPNAKFQKRQINKIPKAFVKGKEIKFKPNKSGDTPFKQKHFNLPKFQNDISYLNPGQSFQSCKSKIQNLPNGNH